MRRYILVALLATFLSACAVGNAGRDDITSHIATAEQYVSLGFTLADACIASGASICASPTFRDGVAKAKVVATEALNEAKAIATSDATQAQTLLRVAMNAVLLFYTLR